MAMLPIKRILCPTDFSDPSLAALKTACELAAHFNALIQVLHVVSFSPPLPTDMVVIAATDFYQTDAERCDAALKRVNEIIDLYVPPGVQAQGAVHLGNAAHEITGAADEIGADVIVMGTHGASGWRHLAFGSVAEKVVRMAGRPVLTVHSGQAPVRSEQLKAAKAA
jgi:nucleotide-binding universal stress UspA family protein